MYDQSIILPTWYHASFSRTTVKCYIVEGPSWLKEDYSQWPQKSTHSTMEVPEVCFQSFTTVQVQESDDLFTWYSSFIKLKKIVALCIRFKDNCMLSKTKMSKICGPIRCEELRKAMIIVVKLHQQKVFLSELYTLQRSKAIDSQQATSV